MRQFEDVLSNRRDEILNLCALLRAEGLVREDYEELVDLVEVYLSEEPNPITIRRPGAIHRARFMGKLLYSIKIDLLSHKITANLPPGAVFGKSQAQKIERFVKFAVFCYVSWWFTAPVSVYAPVNDISFLKGLEAYRQFDEPLVLAALDKFQRHTWYLSQELVPLAFFAGSLCHEEKQKLANKLLALPRSSSNTRTGTGFGRPSLPTLPDNIGTCELADFIGQDSWMFFEIAKIDGSFLSLPVVDWATDSRYKKGRDICLSFRVVNDAAERGIKLTSDYLKSARKESVFQNVLQIVEHDRKVKPKQRKRKNSET